MALNGRLEDLNLLEILQIVAFARKTGTLSVRGTMGSGAVLFKDGVVLCALSTSTTPILSPMAGGTLDQSRAMLLKDEVRIALRELVSLREGTFEFALSDDTPTRLEGLDVRKFLVSGGVDPQELMLELAREIDDERRKSSNLLESPDASASGADEEENAEEPTFAHAGVTVLLVDDEAQVLEVVHAELETAGCTVECASTAEEALGLVDELIESGRPVVLVSDVAMPSSDGESFQGGLEIVAHLKDVNNQAPAMLMAESLSPESRTRARELGVRKVAFKPTLTKLDADEYGADLHAFARVVRRELADLVGEAMRKPESTTVPNLNHDVMFDFLKTMTEQLTRPENGIARMILRVASKYCERVALFLVKGARARGLAGLHVGKTAKQFTSELQNIAFDLQEVRPFAEVVYSRGPLSSSHDRRPLPGVLDPGKRGDYVLLPLLHNHEVLSILLCDNANSGRPLGNLAGLALFLTQAGMAMENASLHRKLRTFENEFSLENQGPLTQELSQIVRETS